MGLCIMGLYYVLISGTNVELSGQNEFVSVVRVASWVAIRGMSGDERSNDGEK